MADSAAHFDIDMSQGTLKLVPWGDWRARFLGALDDDLRDFADDSIGRDLVIDQRKVGLGVDVFANVRITRHDEESLEAFAAAVESHPQIVECFLVGGDSDYLLRVVVGSIEQYERFLKKELVHMPGVASVDSRFALRQIKLTGRLPI